MLAALLLLAAVAWAQAAVQQEHEVSWRVVSAGGQDSASDAHRVQGTLGQLAVGRAAAAEGHVVGAGYWYGATRAAQPAPLRVYLPLVFKIARP